MANWLPSMSIRSWLILKKRNRHLKSVVSKKQKRAEDARRLDEKKTAILERCESNLELLVGTYRPSQILTNGFDKEAQWPSDRDEQLDIIIQAVRWQLQNIVYRLEKLGV